MKLLHHGANYDYGNYINTIDIDECLVNNGTCENICINTEGSFYCQCSTGLELSADNRTCEGKLKLMSIPIALHVQSNFSSTIISGFLDWITDLFMRVHYYVFTLYVSLVDFATSMKLLYHENLL